MFCTTLLANQRTYSRTTSTQMRGNKMLALLRMLRSIMPVPRSRGASIGRDTWIDRQSMSLAVLGMASRGLN